MTAKLQEAPDDNVAPLSETVAEPAVAVMVPPPHDPVRPFGEATATPMGNESVKPMPSTADALLLAIVKANVVVPVTFTCGKPNDLTIPSKNPPLPARTVTDAQD